MRKIIIDTDTATDDAIAIIMALKHNNFDVRAITTVAGNVDIEIATINALYTVELCNKNTPVYRGCVQPLNRELETSKFFHGRDGLGDTGPYNPLQKEENENGVDRIISLVNNHPKEIEIIAIGPLTNIARAFQKYPSIIKKGLRISAAPPGEDPEPACSAISNVLLDPPVVPVNLTTIALPS